MGALIVTKGSINKLLSRETGCHIVVSATSPVVAVRTHEQVVTVRGHSVESVAAARAVIKNTMATQPSPNSSHKGGGRNKVGFKLFNDWAAFINEIANQKMRHLIKEFKVHLPGCMCGAAKADHVHALVAKHINSESGALVVLPVFHDSSGGKPTCAYYCPATSREWWDNNPRDCERALYACISEATNVAIFKTHFAVCMLQEDPNSCVMIVGPIDMVEAAVKDAHLAACLKVEEANSGTQVRAEAPGPSGGGNSHTSTSSGHVSSGRKGNTFKDALGLYHDHAHFLLALPLDALQRAASDPKDIQSQKALHSAMVEAWRNPWELHDGTSGGNNPFVNMDKRKTVELKHHVVTAGPIGFFDQLERAKANLSNINKHNETSTLAVLVVVYEDTKKMILDFPGGKRDLGETTWECARREAEEESSLNIDVDGLRINPPSTATSQRSATVNGGHLGPPHFVCVQEKDNKRGLRKDGMRFLLLMPEENAEMCALGQAFSERAKI